MTSRLSRAPPSTTPTTGALLQVSHPVPCLHAGAMPRRKPPSASPAVGASLCTCHPAPGATPGVSACARCCTRPPPLCRDTRRKESFVNNIQRHGTFTSQRQCEAWLLQVQLHAASARYGGGGCHDHPLRVPGCRHAHHRLCSHGEHGPTRLGIAVHWRMDMAWSRLAGHC